MVARPEKCQLSAPFSRTRRGSTTTTVDITMISSRSTYSCNPKNAGYTTTAVCTERPTAPKVTFRLFRRQRNWGTSRAGYRNTIQLPSLFKPGNSSQKKNGHSHLSYRTAYTKSVAAESHNRLHALASCTTRACQQL